MSKPVRVIVIAVFTVFGTMETLFWARMLWGKFSGNGTEEVGEKD